MKPPRLQPDLRIALLYALFGGSGFQGNRILIARGEYLEEILFLPSGSKLFGMDATFQSFLLFQQVERQSFQSLIFANSTGTFIHGISKVQ